MAGSVGPWGRKNKMMTDAAIERSEKAVTLYRRGKTFREIGKLLNVHFRTVERDVERARKEWREKAAQSYGELLHEHLAKTDEAEAAAWDGWERSVRDELMTGTEESETPQGSVTKTRIRRRNRSGQATFIQTIAGLITLRCRLL